MRILGMKLVSERFDWGGQSRGRVSQDGLLSGFDLPDDLREWVSEVELAHLVAGAVERVSHETEAVGRTRTWDVLLGILAYFYSTGLYVSDEIEEALWSNSNFDSVQTLAFGNAPASAVLRSFRRANRDAIEACLAEVLKSAHSCSRDTSAFGTRARAGSANPSPDFDGEAKERLGRAMQADSWALDN